MLGIANSHLNLYIYQKWEPVKHTSRNCMSTIKEMVPHQTNISLSGKQIETAADVEQFGDRGGNDLAVQGGGKCNISFHVVKRKQLETRQSKTAADTMQKEASKRRPWMTSAQPKSDE